VISGKGTAENRQKMQSIKKGGPERLLKKEENRLGQLRDSRANCKKDERGSVTGTGPTTAESDTRFSGRGNTFSSEGKRGAFTNRDDHFREKTKKTSRNPIHTLKRDHQPEPRGKQRKTLEGVAAPIQRGKPV